MKLLLGPHRCRKKYIELLLIDVLHCGTAEIANFAYFCEK